MTPYTYQRGETISLALDAVTGDSAQITAITAAMKAVPPGRSEAPVTAPIAAALPLLRDQHRAMTQLAGR